MIYSCLCLFDSSRLEYWRSKQVYKSWVFQWMIRIRGGAPTGSKGNESRHFRVETDPHTYDGLLVIVKVRFKADHIHFHIHTCSHIHYTFTNAE